jgi:PDZ domain-containing protein
MGRLGVAGFIRSTKARAITAKAIIHTARMAEPVADIAINDHEKIDVPMNDPIVPLPPTQQPATERSLRVALPLVTVSWLILVAIFAMALVRIDRYEIAPGEAMAVAPRIGFAPVKEGGFTPNRYPAKNEINFVTAFGGQLSILDSILGWIDPYVKVDTYKEHFGTTTPTAARRVGFQAMYGAKQIAEYVAMKKIGLDARLVLGRVVVEDLVCTDAPAKNSGCKMLEIGETITKFNGVATPTLAALANQMKGHAVGDTIELTVIPYEMDAAEPNPATAEKRSITLMESPDTPGKPIIGFVPADTRTVALPFDVNISTTDIGGPSAGLAFTLALLDELTKGNLMGRGRVVATGTMNEDAKVGAIGALEQKAVAVRDAGGTLFLVPAGQTDEEVQAAREAAGSGVKIVKVATLDEALKILRANGGDSLGATAA